MRPAGLAWAAFAILTAGILVFFPDFVLFMAHGAGATFEPAINLGNGLTGRGRLAFSVSVLRELFRRRAGFRRREDYRSRRLTLILIFS